jgi:hypothetical protein
VGTGGTSTGGNGAGGSGGASTGGSGGAAGGGTGAICSTTFQATTSGFVTAPAAGGGCWHGFAFDFADSTTTITPATTSGYASCGAPCSLAAAGTLGAGYTAYAGLGFNLNQPTSGGSATPTLTPTGTSLTISFIHTGPTAFRAELTDGTTSWCAIITGSSPVTIPYSSFNTKCYDTPVDGSQYTKQPINEFELMVAGELTSTSFNIALTSLTEN